MRRPCGLSTPSGNQLMCFKICLQWPTLGPYHVARINALAEKAAGEEIEIIVCETASEDITGRKSVEADLGAQRITVFENRSIANLEPKEVARGVRETLTRTQPDVVAINSYSFADARAGLGWCIDFDRRAILMTDSRREDAARVPWRERLKAELVACYDTALVAGSPHRDYLVELGFATDRIFEGYDVVDNDFFRRGAEEARKTRTGFKDLPGLADPAPFFLAAGRMIARKDYPTLLSAYSNYRDQARDPWRLVIIGDGMLRQQLQEMTEDRHIPGITFAGVQPYEAMPVYYGLAEAFIHTAEADQWGLVINEAMAAGLPVIVSDGTGCVEDLVVNGKSGFVFRSGDVVALASLMLRLSREAGLRAEMASESQRIIGAWGPERFAMSMIRAAECALRDPTGRPRTGRWLLAALQALAKSPTSFHTVES